MADTVVLDQRHTELVESGVSIRVASRDAGNGSSLALGLGCHVAEGGRRVTIYLATIPGRTVIDHVRQSGVVAASFHQVGTNRTIQIKGHQGRVRPAAEPDRTQLARYLALFETAVSAYGFDSRLVRGGMGYALEDISAISFTLETAFSQTPGPQAGGPLQQ